jgi:hypothetical protein
MRSNCLQLNASKLEMLLSASGREGHLLPMYRIHVCTDSVRPSGVVRDVGIYIDRDVTMRTHVMCEVRLV